MAKATKGLRQALKAVDALGGQMGGEREGDYRVALSASAAGQKNLSKQTRALTRDLLAGQLTQNASLSKLARQGGRQPGVVARQQAGTTSRYGSALGESIAGSYKVAGAVAAGTAKKTGAAAAAGVAQTQAAITVAGIAKQGVKAQKAAGEYSLNQALQQRTIIDNQTLASLTGQLYQTALQYNMQWQMWKKQQDYALKAADKAQNKELRDAAEALPGQAPQWGVDAWKIVDDYSQANDGDLSQFNITEAATTWASQNGYNPAGTEAGVVVAIMRGLKAGQPTATATVNAMDTLFGGLHQWDKIGYSIKSSVVAGEEVAFAAYLAQLQQQQGPPPVLNPNAGQPANSGYSPSGAPNPKGYGAGLGG